jgi:very-short-patch-repair endonuclease
MTERHEIPVMTVERTLLSLAATVSSRELETALVMADRGGLLSKRALALVLERGRGWRGIGTLKRLVGQMAPVHRLTRSTLEDIFIAHCRENRLPEPQVNSMVEGLEVDLFWSGARLVVELDGYESHGDRFAFERDRRRDASLVCAGYRVVRFTYRAVIGDLPRCLTTVQTLLEETASSEPPELSVKATG